MSESKNYQFIDSFSLKLIAVITMLIDHVGCVLYPHNLIFRYIGRIAFPIYVFMIVEGFFHTRNVRKYEIRLFIFALISELPFDLAFEWKLFDWGSQNVFFTLLIGLVAIDIIENHCKDNISCQAAVWLVAAFLGEFLSTDYGGAGVCFILIFYKFRNKPQFIKWLLFIAISFFVWGKIELYGIIAAIPVALYNGKAYNVKAMNESRSFKQGVKYVFYAFYPVHLLVIYFISQHWNYGAVL